MLHNARAERRSLLHQGDDRVQSLEAKRAAERAVPHQAREDSDRARLQRQLEARDVRAAAKERARKIAGQPSGQRPRQLHLEAAGKSVNF